MAPLGVPQNNRNLIVALKVPSLLRKEQKSGPDFCGSKHKHSKQELTETSTDFGSGFYTSIESIRAKCNAHISEDIAFQQIASLAFSTSDMEAVDIVTGTSFTVGYWAG